MSILLTESDLTATEAATLRDWPEERRERLREDVVAFVRKKLDGAAASIQPDPIVMTDEGPAPCGILLMGPSKVVPPLPGGRYIPDPVFLRDEMYDRHVR